MTKADTTADPTFQASLDLEQMQVVDWDSSCDDYDMFKVVSLLESDPQALLSLLKEGKAKSVPLFCFVLCFHSKMALFGTGHEIARSVSGVEVPLLCIQLYSSQRDDLIVFRPGRSF